MPRFFCPGPLNVGAHITLPESIAHHVRVLRLAANGSVALFNGEGGEFSATLHTIDKKIVTAEIKSFSPREAELPYAVTVAQALPEASKMDWIIEKAVELGAGTLQPLAAQRCVAKLSADRAVKKMQHWQGIAVAATEQCGRNRLLQLAYPADFASWVRLPAAHQRIFLSPHAEQSLSDWARQQSPQALTFMIGPEGGWTEQEESIARAHGAIALSMGPRVLRTETAGLAALAALNAVWGGI